MRKMMIAVLAATLLIGGCAHSRDELAYLYWNIDCDGLAVGVHDGSNYAGYPSNTTPSAKGEVRWPKKGVR